MRRHGRGTVIDDLGHFSIPREVFSLVDHLGHLHLQVRVRRGGVWRFINPPFP